MLKSVLLIKMPNRDIGIASNTMRNCSSLISVEIRCSGGSVNADSVKALSETAGSLQQSVLIAG